MFHNVPFPLKTGCVDVIARVHVLPLWFLAPLDREDPSKICIPKRPRVAFQKDWTRLCDKASCQLATPATNPGPCAHARFQFNDTPDVFEH
jgi:hypothetical protein